MMMTIHPVLHFRRKWDLCTSLYIIPSRYFSICQFPPLIFFAISLHLPYTNILLSLISHLLELQKKIILSIVYSSSTPPFLFPPYLLQLSVLHIERVQFSFAQKVYHSWLPTSLATVDSSGTRTLLLHYWNYCIFHHLVYFLMQTCIAVVKTFWYDSHSCLEFCLTALCFKILLLFLLSKEGKYYSDVYRKCGTHARGLPKTWPWEQQEWKKT